MRITALVLWIVTACAGFYLLLAWVSGGGIRLRTGAATSYDVILIFLHPALATTGLGLWIAYVLTAQSRFAWAAFGVVCGSALLGFALLTRCLSGHGGRHAKRARPQFPGYVVVAHVAVGVATFVVVLIIATIVSRG